MEEHKGDEKKSNRSYRRFFTMMVISFVIMYIVMFLNLDRIAHYHTSTTRIYMAILMVAPMAIQMMIMMHNMYPNKKANTSIVLSAIGVFVFTLIGLRTQTPIGEIQYMKAMIPHHSSAIMVSKNANLKDPDVRKLAEQIIQSQEKEIAEMNSLLKRLKK